MGVAYRRNLVKLFSLVSVWWYVLRGTMRKQEVHVGQVTCSWFSILDEIFKWGEGNYRQAVPLTCDLATACSFWNWCGELKLSMYLEEKAECAGCWWVWIATFNTSELWLAFLESREIELSKGWKCFSFIPGYVLVKTNVQWMYSFQVRMASDLPGYLEMGVFASNSN